MLEKRILYTNFLNIPRASRINLQKLRRHIQLPFGTVTYMAERVCFNKKLKHHHYQISNKANAWPLLSPN